MMITLYGIPNCDTVKKARAWLAAQGIAYTFYDYKKQGVPAAKLDGWIAQLGWQKLINRQGTTWRKLDADTQAQVVDETSAKALMQAHPSLIKRPILESDHGLQLGFDANHWQVLLAS
jgi:arsenate reductase (glutaredoxin)